MTFLSQIQRVRRRLRAGRFFAAVLALLAGALGLWLAFGLADALAAPEPSARLVITGLLLALCGAAFLVLGIRALRFSAPDAARHADAVAGDARRTAASALSVDPAAAETPLARLLADRLHASAAQSLAPLSARRLVPRRLLLVPAAALAAMLAGVVGLSLAHPAAFDTVLRRLLHPGADIPPYTPLNFQVGPAPLAAVYGGGLELVADITGGELAHPVECLVRKAGGGPVLRLPAFRETPTRFTREMEGLTGPVEVAFACGKARSTWHPVEILLQPNLLAGRVRVVPPAHTGLPASEVPLDSNQIVALEGSAVTLELDSNRPLSSATLVFTPAAGAGPAIAASTLNAEVTAPNTVSFTWTATRSGRISATLRDTRGTPGARPLEVAFRAFPDLPPSVSLASPPPMLLATPTTVVPIAGQAEDDFGLSRMHLVRALSGFRERAHLAASGLRDRVHEVTGELDLGELGLQPGQVIEVMLDASDHNPSLLGQGASEISRIQIISEDQYAEYIRLRTTLEEFAARFQAARDAIENARKSLEELARTVEGKEPEAIKKSADKAAEAHRKSADLLGKIARDFPAYELENTLRELAERQVDTLMENMDALAHLDAAAPAETLREQVQELRDRLGKNQPAEEDLKKKADLAQQAGRIMEMSARFRQIYESQKNLAGRFGAILKELREGNSLNRRQIPLLAETQQKNRLALDEFKKEFRRRLEEMPQADPQLAELLESSRQFLDALDEAQPETLMDAASSHGRDGEAQPAYEKAEQARAALERLLNSGGSCAGGACGKPPRFSVPDLDQTMAQMLQALLRQNAGGAPQMGMGSNPGGMGYGPAGLGGGTMDGMPMDIPMAGPQRMSFESLASASGRGGPDRPGRATRPLPSTAESASAASTGHRFSPSSSLEQDAVPEIYRAAVNRFLSP